MAYLANCLDSGSASGVGSDGDAGASQHVEAARQINDPVYEQHFWCNGAVSQDSTHAVRHVRDARNEACRALMQCCADLAVALMYAEKNYINQETHNANDLDRAGSSFTTTKSD